MLDIFLRIAIGLVIFLLIASHGIAQSLDSSTPSNGSFDFEAIQGVEYPPLAIPAPVQAERECSITDVVVLIDSTKSMGGYAKNQTKLSVAQWCVGIVDELPLEKWKLQRVGTQAIQGGMWLIVQLALNK